MKPGNYQKAYSYEKIHKLQTLKYRPRIYREMKHNKLRGTCGTSALATITGIHPLKVDARLAPTAKYWRDRPMRRFLARNGFRTIPVTMCDVTSESGYIKYPIRRFHVLLASQLMVRNEGSWSVIHRNRVYHNMEETRLDPLEFLNNPIMTVYIVWHPSWKVRNPQIFKALEDPLFSDAYFRGKNLAGMQLHNLVGYSPRYSFANMR